MTDKIHTIRHQDGGTVTVPHYLPRKAIRAFCTECMGWNMHPNECTAPKCPLYPYRGKLMMGKVRRHGPSDSV